MARALFSCAACRLALVVCAAVCCFATRPMVVASAPAPSVLCLEQVVAVSDPIFLQGHPAGQWLVLAQQSGVINLLTRPTVNSGILASTVSTFLNLSSRVIYSDERGLLGFAFHPQFLDNGRFFVSYICNGTLNPDCQAHCPCSAKYGCGSPLNTATDCADFTVVSEYRVPVGCSPTNATSLNATEVKKWINFGRPFSGQNGGDIWFGTDGYLYYASGDGGSSGDPLLTSQNLEVPLGKILRINVNVPLVSNFDIPPDNPFVSTPGALPEIYAYGFRNPWRCSQDVWTNTTICGDDGLKKYEEVDIIQSGGNYGWSFYEANITYKGTPPNGTVFQWPVLTYAHDGLPKAIFGGYIYRASRNPCLQGRYIYGDLFLLTTWAAQVLTYPASTSPMTIQVARGAPLNATEDFLLSWGQDASFELYRLSTSGVYRVTNTSACNAIC